MAFWLKLSLKIAVFLLFLGEILGQIITQFSVILMRFLA